MTAVKGYPSAFSHFPTVGAVRTNGQPIPSVHRLTINLNMSLHCFRLLVQPCMSAGLVLRLQEEGDMTVFEIRVVREPFCHMMEHLRKNEYNSYWKTKMGGIFVFISPENHDYKKILIYCKFCGFQGDRMQ
jgi:hypothetical protein